MYKYSKYYNTDQLDLIELLCNNIYMSLKLKDTLKMLRKSDIPMSTISNDTGLGVRWLYRLADDDYKDPGIKKIERLYSYLTQSG